MREMLSISTLEVRGRVNRCGRVTGSGTVEEDLSARKLLERINSSCSSGYERRKSVSGSGGTINRAAHHGNLEALKYCVANECPLGE